MKSEIEINEAILTCKSVIERLTSELKEAKSTADKCQINETIKRFKIREWILRWNLGEVDDWI